MSDPVIVQMDVVQAELDEFRAIYTSEHPPPEPVPEVIRIKPGDDADAAFKQCLSESKSLAAAPGEISGELGRCPTTTTGMSW